jgi:hypothetical protein
MDTATIQTWLSIIKDIVTIVAAGVAAYVGFRGLQTWQRQLRGNAEYDLARRVLVAVYKVRDVINNCRLLASELDSETMDITKQIHESHFAKLDEAQASLDVELLETQAIWGNEQSYRMRIRLFLSLGQVLKNAFWQYYLPYSEDTNKVEKAHGVLFTDRDHKDDFSVMLDTAVKEMEDMLRPKLTLKQVKRKKGHWWDRFGKRKK